jgi:hypothetical protein
VLLLAIVAILSISAYIYGNAEINKLEDAPLGANAESMMISADAAIQTVAHGDINFTTVMDLYYPKGVVRVDEANNWIKYAAQINSNVYEEITAPANGCAPLSACRCNRTSTIINDTDTTINMGRVMYTNVYRGAQGDDSQYVEIVSCDDSIEIYADSTCAGKSGPRSRMTIRKIGYNSTSNKPMVVVRVC